MNTLFFEIININIPRFHLLFCNVNILATYDPDHYTMNIYQSILMNKSGYTEGGRPGIMCRISQVTTYNNENWKFEICHYFFIMEKRGKFYSSSEVNRNFCSVGCWREWPVFN